jgi:hypothetical protein
MVTGNELVEPSKDTGKGPKKGAKGGKRGKSGAPDGW